MNEGFAPVDVPVLLVVFNRPDKTALVLDALRKVKPASVFVSADGPRMGRIDDIDGCRLTRELVAQIDWPCEVKTRFFDVNMGCDPHVATAIDWFFESVEYGVILEDDVIPHPDFFGFCAELFVRYADDERVMQIAGFAPYPERTYEYSYHFSNMFRCFGGWGTWRRAWKFFTFSMAGFDLSCVDEMLRNAYLEPRLRKVRKDLFLAYLAGERQNWDYLWNFICNAQNGLCVYPECNLIVNVGFDDSATHTTVVEPVYTERELQSLNFPLKHPYMVFPDSRPELGFENSYYCSLGFRRRCLRQARHFWGVTQDYFATMPRH